MNKTLRELQARKAKQVAAMRAVTDKASADGGRDLNEAEAAAFATIKAEVESLNARIEREQALAAEEATLGTVAILPGNAITESRDNALAAAPGRHGFASFGEFAQAVRAADLGMGFDRRLGIGAAAPGTTANEGIGADGGFMVPPDYSTDLFRLSLGEDSLLPLTANVETTSNSMVFPKTEQTPWGSNGVRAYWQAEAGAATATKPVLGTNILRLHKLMALVPITDELLSDARALEMELQSLIADSIRWKTNEAILFGSGAGQPLGVTNSPAIVTVAKEAGQATLTLQVLNIAKMIARLPGGSYGNAVWIINNDVLPALFTLTLGNYPIYMPTSEGAKVNPYGTLMGRPIMVSQHAASFSAQGDVQLHDLSYYRTLTKAGGLQTATSMHLYFDADAAAFRVTFRVDGQPKLAAPITPAKGTNTLSPFLQLQAR